MPFFIVEHFSATEHTKYDQILNWISSDFLQFSAVRSFNIFHVWSSSIEIILLYFFPAGKCWKEKFPLYISPFILVDLMKVYRHSFGSTVHTEWHEKFYCFNIFLLYLFFVDKPSRNSIILWFMQLPGYYTLNIPYTRCCWESPGMMF